MNNLLQLSRIHVLLTGQATFGGPSELALSVAKDLIENGMARWRLPFDTTRPQWPNFCELEILSGSAPQTPQELVDLIQAGRSVERLKAPHL